MKIAYQEKNIIPTQGSEWEYCDGCIFNMEEKIIKGDGTPVVWPCDLFHPTCRGYDIYEQSDDLDKIFEV